MELWPAQWGAPWCQEWVSGRSKKKKESLCRREEELRAPTISLFWKRSVSLSFWMSSFCLCWVGVFCVLGLFSFPAIWRHLAFCISPVLLQPENSWPTTTRFDDRQSLERARHGLKKKVMLNGCIVTFCGRCSMWWNLARCPECGMLILVVASAIVTDASWEALHYTFCGRRNIWWCWSVFFFAARATFRDVDLP